MSIFISIASYNDPILEFTIKSAYTKAAKPDELHFGIVDQNLVGLNSTIPKELPESQYTLIQIPIDQARGPCFARNLAMNLYRGEDYFLQVDSHILFEQDWDLTVIKQLQQVKPNSVLSSYPYTFEIKRGKPVINKLEPGTALVHHVVADYAEAGYKLMFSSRRKITETPVPTIHIAGGFLFAAGDYVDKFPYDPYYYFIGEEQSLALRLFTHGWNLYNFAHCPAYHQYSTTGADAIRAHHWGDKVDSTRKERWWELDRRSDARLTKLVTGSDLGVYSIGIRRTLDQWADYSGIDYPQKKIHDRALNWGL